MKNNLLNKYLLSSYIASVLFVGTAGVATFFAKKEVQMANAHPEKKELVDNCKSTCFLCLVTALVCVIMSVFCGLKYPMITKRQVKYMTKHYLQDIFTRYPEMRQYRSVLENSQKVYEIAAVACNGLTKDEQQEILNLVKKELDNNSNLHKIESLIINIIQKHAEKDPEYMNKILYTIANAQNANFIEAAQKVR